MNDDARGRLQLVADERLHPGGRDAPVAGEVSLHVVGRADVVVVQIEPVRETANAFEAADRGRLELIARAGHFADVWRLGRQRRELFVDRFLQLLDGVAWTRSGLDLERGTERERVLVRRHVLCDLTL